MGANGVRIIVVTRSSELFQTVKEGLQADARVEMLLHVMAPAEAENKLSRTRPNLMLLDLDDNAPRHLFLKQMCDRFELRIILTSRSRVYAVPLTKEPIKDFLLKPPGFTVRTVPDYVNFIKERLGGGRTSAAAVEVKSTQPLSDINTKIIAIASSTGGTDALEKIFRALPAGLPPILVVQHMPSGFTKLFADRLNSFCRMEIREPIAGESIRKGVVYIARAGVHMKMTKQGARLLVEYAEGARVHGVIPAADVLFESVAEISKRNAIGVVLTGMGTDGAKGLMRMHLQGARTVGQNKETCVVYGMPKAAMDLGAIDKELPLDKIAGELVRLSGM